MDFSSQKETLLSPQLFTDGVCEKHLLENSLGPGT